MKDIARQAKLAFVVETKLLLYNDPCVGSKCFSIHLSMNECGLRHHPKCTVAVYHSWRTCKPSKRGARKEHTELFFFQLSAPRIG